MAPNHVDQPTIRQYLLGSLPSELQQRVEERLLTEAELLESLEIEEDELIDEYLAEKLSEEERQKFEQYFLGTPERQQNLRFARALRRYVVTTASQNTAASATPFARFRDNQTWGTRAAIALVIIVVASAFWLFRTNTSPSLTSAALALNISADNNRAAGVDVAKVHLPRNIDELRLSLRLPEGTSGAPRYRVTLDYVDSAQAQPRSFGPPEQGAGSLLVVIPTAELARGRYALKVFATQSDGTEQRIPGAYYFEVE